MPTDGVRTDQCDQPLNEVWGVVDCALEVSPPPNKPLHSVHTNVFVRASRKQASKQSSLSPSPGVATSANNL